MTSSTAYAETAILAHALRDRIFLTDLTGLIAPRMFTDRRRGSLLELILTRARTGEPFTTSSLLAWLDAREIPAALKSSIASLVVDVDGAQTDNVTARTCVEAVRRAHERTLMERAMRTALDHLGRDQVEDARTVFAKFLDETTDDGQFRVFASPADDRESPLKRYEDAATGKISLGMPYGFAGLDAITTGFRPKELTVWAGAPGELKTTAAVKIAMETTERGGDVLFVSLEMGFESIELKAHASYAFKKWNYALDTQAIRQGRLTPEALAVYRQAVAEFDPHGRLHVWSAGGATLPEIEQRIGALSTGRPLALVVIDYLQLVPQTGDRWIPDSQHAQHLFRETKRIAMRRNCHVLALNQINRDGRMAAETRGYYMMEDLAGSSEVEKSADVVFWSLLTDAMRASATAHVGCMKNRYGAPIMRGYPIYARPGCEALSDAAEPTDQGTIRQLVAAARSL